MSGRDRQDADGRPLAEKSKLRRRRTNKTHKRKRTHKRTYKRTHKGGSSKKGMKKIICRKMFFDKDDPCLPRNTLNNFYFETPSPCYENHRGAHINLNAKGCAWYDIDTNKKVSSDFDKFKNKNLHGKSKKQYVWKKN